MSIDQCTTIKTGGSVPICFPWQAGGGQGVPYDKDMAGTMSKSQTLALCVTGDVTHALTTEGADASEDGTGRGTPIIAFSGKDYGASHQNGGGQVAVAFDTTQITSKANYSNPQPGDPCLPLAAGAHPPALATSMAVRRLTPRECERLQGWPDDHTLVPYRGKPMADGPRYKIIGNGWALPCVQWIGRRIVNQFKVNS